MGEGVVDFSGDVRLQCQICGKLGHLTRRCYYRYDSSYDDSATENPNFRPQHKRPMLVGSFGSSSHWLGTITVGNGHHVAIFRTGLSFF